MNRSDSALRGQLPSLSPPTTSVSTLCSRASSAPQMATRPSPPAAGLTISGRDQRRHISGHSSAANGSPRSRPTSAAQEAGKLFAGIACIEPVEAAVLVAAKRLQRHDRWRARSRRSRSSACSRQGGQRRDAAPRRRKHRARVVERRSRRCAPDQKRRLRSPAETAQPRSKSSASAADIRPAGAAAQRHQFDRFGSVPHLAALGMPSRSNGCFSSARIATGSPGRNTASSSSAQKLAGGVRGQRRAAGIVGPDAEAQQFRPDAARQVAVAGDQRRRRRRARRSRRAAPWRSPAPRRARSPLRSASRRRAPRRFRLSVNARAADAQSSVVSAGRSASRPASRRAAPAACERRRSRRRRRGRRRSCRSSLARPYCGWPNTDGCGAARRSPPMTRSSSAMSRPGRTTAPLRQTRNHRQQFGGGRDRAGRTGGDHRAGGGFALQPLGLERGSARCDGRPGWTAALAQHAPASASVTISRNSSVTCHQPARLPDTSSPSFAQSDAFGLDLVDQRGEIARQPDGIGRRGRHDDFFLEHRGDMRRQPALPGAAPAAPAAATGPVGAIGGARSISPAPSARTRLRPRRTRRAGGLPAGSPSGRLAARRTRCAARARRGASARRWWRRPASADRRPRRIPGPALPRARLGQGRQEGRAGRDREDARSASRRLIDPSPSAAATAASASGIASGVPTVIQLAVHLHAVTAGRRRWRGRNRG